MVGYVRWPTSESRENVHADVAVGEDVPLRAESAKVAECKCCNGLQRVDGAETLAQSGSGRRQLPLAGTCRSHHREESDNSRIAVVASYRCHWRCTLAGVLGQLICGWAWTNLGHEPKSKKTVIKKRKGKR